MSISEKSRTMPKEGTQRRRVKSPKGVHNGQVPITQATNGLFWWLMVLLQGTVFVATAGLVHVLAGLGLWLIVLRPVALWLLPRLAREESPVDVRRTLGEVRALVAWTRGLVARVRSRSQASPAASGESGSALLALAVRLAVGTIAVLSVLVLAAPGRRLFAAAAVLLLVVYWSRSRVRQVRNRQRTVVRPAGRASS